MATVHLTQNLRRFFPELGTEQVQAATVSALIDVLDGKHPGLRGYLCADDGSLRKHVHVFVDGEMVGDRAALSDPVGSGSEVHIIQALSGG